jgi:hypothetical protein
VIIDQQGDVMLMVVVNVLKEQRNIVFRMVVVEDVLMKDAIKEQGIDCFVQLMGVERDVIIMVSRGRRCHHHHHHHHYRHHYHHLVTSKVVASRL